MCFTGKIPRINATEICIKKTNNQHLEVENPLQRSVLRNCFHNSLHMNALSEFLLSQLLLFLGSLFSAFWSLSEPLTSGELWKNLSVHYQKEDSICLVFPKRNLAAVSVAVRSTADINNNKLSCWIEAYNFLSFL